MGVTTRAQVKFIFSEPSYDIIPFTKSGQASSSSKTAHPTAPRPTVQPQILFKTIFRNNTEGEQEYSFKTERVTRSTATVCVEKGFTRGASFELKLKTPCEIAEAGVGFHRELTVCNIGEDTVEEELIWSVDNMVRVPAHTETIAELVITEANCQGSFVMNTKFKCVWHSLHHMGEITYCRGRAVVTVTNLRENNELVTIVEGQVKDIVAQEMQHAPHSAFTFDAQGWVNVATRGKCNFKYGVEQKIQLFQRTLPELAGPD